MFNKNRNIEKTPEIVTQKQINNNLKETKLK